VRRNSYISYVYCGVQELCTVSRVIVYTLLSSLCTLYDEGLLCNIPVSFLLFLAAQHYLQRMQTVFRRMCCVLQFIFDVAADVVLLPDLAQVFWQQVSEVWG
jgi:hypothetical protein